MTYYRLKTDSLGTSFLLQKSSYCYVPPENQKPNTGPRHLSAVGSDSYKRSLRRAFSRAKSIAFFNPDLTQFITFTYKGIDHTPLSVVQDIKLLALRHKRSSNKPFKYIYVMEYQKRGSIHVHMIANDSLQLETNKNGHLSVKDWSHGFTSVLTINDFDNNFRPYLYLFKYMAKAQRIGASFIHCSRNFDKIRVLDYDQYTTRLKEENLLYKEDYDFTIDEKQYSITKEYYREVTP